MSSFVFDEVPISPEDELLINLYEMSGRSVEALAYTPEFDRLFERYCATFPGAQKHQVFERLLRLRKAGLLPWMASTLADKVEISPTDRGTVTSLASSRFPLPGMRDRVAYTPEFDTFVADVNTYLSGVPLSPNTILRLVLQGSD